MICKALHQKLFLILLAHNFFTWIYDCILFFRIFYISFCMLQFSQLYVAERYHFNIFWLFFIIIPSLSVKVLKHAMKIVKLYIFERMWGHLVTAKAKISDVDLKCLFRLPCSYLCNIFRSTLCTQYALLLFQGTADSQVVSHRRNDEKQNILNNSPSPSEKWDPKLPLLHFQKKFRMILMSMPNKM